MNTTTNSITASQIVRALEAKGESKDYIIGFLVGTIDGLRHEANGAAEQYMKQTLKQVEDKA